MVVEKATPSRVAIIQISYDGPNLRTDSAVSRAKVENHEESSEDNAQNGEGSADEKSDGGEGCLRGGSLSPGKLWKREPGPGS